MSDILSMLIYIVVVAIVFYLVMWVLEEVGVPIPAKVKHLLMVLFALVVIVWLLRGGIPRLI